MVREGVRERHRGGAVGESALPRACVVKTRWRDELRKERLARMKKLGIVDSKLSPLEPETAPRWNLTDAEMHS